MGPYAPNITASNASAHSANSEGFVAVLARAYTLSEIFPLHHPTVRDAVRDIAGSLEGFAGTVVDVARTGLTTVEGSVAIPDPHGHVREFARDLSLAGVTQLGLPQGLEPGQVEHFMTALRVVTEDPTIALDGFLSRDGGNAVELAFHGEERAPVAAAVDEASVEPDAAEPDAVETVADESVAAPAGFEPTAAQDQYTVEQEIDDELQLVPLGAFVPEDPIEDDPIEEAAFEEAAFEEAVFEEAAVDAAPAPEPTQTSGWIAEPEPAALVADAPEAGEEQITEELSWQDEVRARLLMQSSGLSDPGEVGPSAESTADPSDLLPTVDVPPLDVPDAVDVDATTEWMPEDEDIEPVAAPAENFEGAEPALAHDAAFAGADLENADLDVADLDAEDLDAEDSEDADVQDETTLDEAFDEAELPLSPNTSSAAAAEYARQWGSDLVDELDVEWEQAQVAEAAMDLGVGSTVSDTDVATDHPPVEPVLDPSEEYELEAAQQLEERPLDVGFWSEDSTTTEPVVEAVADASPSASSGDSPATAVPPDTHMAAPEELADPAAPMSPAVALAAPVVEQVEAFQAALRDGDSNEPAAEGETELWEPAVNDHLSTLWDPEAAMWVDGSDHPDGTEDAVATPDSSFDEDDEERVPPVEDLAPDGPSLLEAQEAVFDEPEVVMAEAPALPVPDTDPEVAALESALEAEAELDEGPLPELFPAEPVANNHTPEPQVEDASALDTGNEPAPAELFPKFAEAFTTAQAIERPALNRQLLDIAVELRESGDFTTLATGIEVLVRNAVPGDDGAVELARTMAEPEVIEALCQHLADVRDPDRRDELVYVFGQLSGLMAPALANELSEVPPRAARRNYMDALFRMGSDAVAVAVPMLDDSRWFIVRNGVDILGEAGDEGSVARLAPSLAHPDQRVRRATVMALAKLGGMRAGTELLPVLEDPSAEVREGAAMALGHLRFAKALRPLLELLERDKEDDTQMVILRALGQIGDPGAVPAIEKRAVGFFFIKPSKAVRIAAYRALAGIGTPHARKLVREAINDRDPEIAAAAQALAGLLQDEPEPAEMLS